MMKTFFLITAMAIAGVSYAQAPQITASDIELSQRTTKRVNEFNAMVMEKVDQIMTAAQLDTRKKGELTELVGSKEAMLIRINDHDIPADQKQAQMDQVRQEYLANMQRFLGSKFESVSKKVGL